MPGTHTAPGGCNKMPNRIPPIRFLIVVGGTGKGLLGQTRALGFKQEWQLDVDTERKPLENAEFTKFVALDQHVVSVPVLANYYQSLLANADNPEVQAEPAPYLDHGLSTAASRRHAEYYWRNVPAALLRFGLAQSPATGSATVRYPATRRTLREAFSPIKHAAGEQGVEVWIVSSTAGGTGQGVHRFVGAMIAQLLQDTSCFVGLNFVQVGQTTYTTAGEQTKTNTFLGVAADVAFHHLAEKINKLAVANFYYLDLPDVGNGGDANAIRQQIVEMSIKTLMLEDMNVDLTQLTINRSGLRFVLARTGFWGRDYSQDAKYQQSLTALHGKLKALISEGAEFNQNAAKILRESTTLNTSPAFDTTSPDYQRALESVQQVNTIQAWLNNNRVPIPAIGIRANVPPLYRDWSDATKRDYAALRAQWTTCFETGFGFVVENLGAKITHTKVSRTYGGTEEAAPVTQTTIVPLAAIAPPQQDQLNQPWLDAINDLHIVRVWCRCLLEGQTYAELVSGARYDFLVEAQNAAKAVAPWLVGNRRKAESLKAILPKLLNSLAMVTFLEKELPAAENLLTAALTTPKAISDYGQKQLIALGAGVAAAPAGQTVIFTAGLADEVDNTSHQTWLKVLERAVQHNSPTEFHQAVLVGAVGLTQQGLAQVMDLPPNADQLQIIARLRGEPANNQDQAVNMIRGVSRASIWWQRTEPPGIPEDAQYHYRILPKLEPGLFNTIKNNIGSDTNTGGHIKTLEEKFGRTGLYVMTFHGVSLNNEFGDVKATPKHMLGLLKQYMENLMDHWYPDETQIAGNTSANYRIAAASAIGEPLDLPALIQAKLELKQILMLARYFPMHSKSRTDIELPSIMSELSEVEAEFQRLGPA